MSTSKNTSKLKKVIIILGIIILPLLYSFIYLKGFWDPYGKLENVPIALVNNDKCEESMYYNNIPCGDIAFQSSYALIKDKEIIEHQDFENYPIVFATSKDPIYTKIERDYNE